MAGGGLLLSSLGSEIPPGGAVLALSPRTGGWGAFAFPRGHPPILSSAASVLLPRTFPARFAWVVATPLLFPSSVWTDHPALYLADASHGPYVPLKECDDPGPYVSALHPFGIDCAVFHRRPARFLCAWDPGFPVASVEETVPGPPRAPAHLVEDRLTVYPLISGRLFCSVAQRLSLCQDHAVLTITAL